MIVVGLRRRVRDRRRRAARERGAQASRVAGHDRDLEVVVYCRWCLIGRVDVVERELVHHAAEAREVAFAVDAVEAVVDRVAEPRGRRLGEVQRVLLQERRASARTARCVRPLSTSVSSSRSAARSANSAFVVRQRADPDLEQLLRGAARSRAASCARRPRGTPRCTSSRRSSGRAPRGSPGTGGSTGCGARRATSSRSTARRSRARRGARRSGSRS